MKKPSLEEVKEYFKNAKTVQCLDDNDEYILDLTQDFDVTKTCIWLLNQIDKPFSGSNTMCMVWNVKYGFAKILTYKEKTFSITESQIKELYETIETHIPKYSKDRLKELFPEAFKSEIKLEVNVWYVDMFKRLFVPTKIIDSENCLGYGFGCIHDNFISESTEVEWEINGSERQATEQEVFEALSREIDKRYKVGDYIQNHQGTWRLKNINLIHRFKSEHGNTGVYNKQESGKWLILNGKWADVLDQITLSEAEQQLKKKIIV